MSKQVIGGMGGLPPPWLLGKMEKPSVEKDMGTFTALVFSEEQQNRLGVDEHGHKKEHAAPAPVGVLGPAWTRGEIEAPAGEKDMGGWTAAVYTEEQMTRLTVDQYGAKKRAIVGGSAGLPPSWLSGKTEAPLGSKDMGGWTAAVFTEEQQTRLNVDEQGQAKEERVLFLCYVSESPRFRAFFFSG